jgi:hypothetical protein
MIIVSVIPPINPDIIATKKYENHKISQLFKQHSYGRLLHHQFDFAVFGQAF